MKKSLTIACLFFLMLSYGQKNTVDYTKTESTFITFQVGGANRGMAAIGGDFTYTFGRGIYSLSGSTASTIFSTASLKTFGFTYGRYFENDWLLLSISAGLGYVNYYSSGFDSTLKQGYCQSMGIPVQGKFVLKGCGLGLSLSLNTITFSKGIYTSLMLGITLGEY